MKLASRVSLIKPSPTMAITMKAQALRAAGKDVVGFGAGEPDFDTPDHIKMAAIAAIGEGFTKYTAVGGIDALKDAIREKLSRDNGLSYQRSQIVVSCGAKHTLFNLAQVLFEEGDEVIIPAPYWVSYPDIVVLSGAHPVIVQTREEDGFRLRPKDLEEAMTSRTRAVILNSPSNPSGAAYGKADLEALGHVLRKRDVLALSDDIYEKILYDGLAFHNIATACPDLRDQTVVINGVSKAYAMTGWRIGYAAGPETIMAAVTKMQSQSTTNPTSIAQKASVAALAGRQDVVSEMVEAFRQRREFIVDALRAIPGVTCRKPEGAFYVFPNVSALYGRSFQGKPIADSSALAAYLLEEANVALVPGREFGQDGHVRLSYATSMANIEKGVARIREAVLRLA